MVLLVMLNGSCSGHGQYMCAMSSRMLGSCVKPLLSRFAFSWSPGHNCLGFFQQSHLFIPSSFFVMILPSIHSDFIRTFSRFLTLFTLFSGLSPTSALPNHTVLALFDSVFTLFSDFLHNCTHLVCVFICRLGILVVFLELAGPCISSV